MTKTEKVKACIGVAARKKSHFLLSGKVRGKKWKFDVGGKIDTDQKPVKGTRNFTLKPEEYVNVHTASPVER